MATLQQLQAFRDSLFESRMSGARRVRDQNGEEIEYKSDSEMARALAALDAEIAGLQSKPNRVVYFNTSKGI